jgi:hypothetical protein
MDTSDSELYSSSNQEYRDATALQIRLNTGDLLATIEKNLRGAVSVYEYDEQGNPQSVIKTFGKPQCNDIGVQKIMNFVSSIINPSVVMGNFKEEYFHDYIFDFETTLTKMLIKNRIRWEIEIAEIEPIKDSVLFLTIPFISRLINNEERKSMTLTTHTQESNVVQNGSQGFNLFGKSRG